MQLKKGHRLFLLAFLLVLGMIVSPVYAALEPLTWSSCDGSGSSSACMAAMDWDGFTDYWQTGSVNSGNGVEMLAYCGESCSRNFSAYSLTAANSEDRWLLMPQSWKVYGWFPNFTTFLLDEQTGQTFSSGETKNYTITNPNKSINFQRIQFTEKHAHENYWSIIQAFDVFTGEECEEISTDFSCSPRNTTTSSTISCDASSEPTGYSWTWLVTHNSTGTYHAGDTYFTGDTFNWTADLGEWYDVALTIDTDCDVDTLTRPHYVGPLDPTAVTPVPSLSPVPTRIVENIVNKTKLREDASGLIFIGNLSGPYLNMSDYFADGINATMFEIIDIFVTPIDWMNDAVEGVAESIDDIGTDLISQSTIFLGIMARALAALPAVLINIVTLGLCLDIVRIVLKGRGGE